MTRTAPLLGTLAVLGALVLAACNGDSEGTPTSEATPPVTTSATPEASATAEVTRTPPPAVTAVIPPEVTLADLAPPPGRILHRCDDGWCVQHLNGAIGAPLAGLPMNSNALTASPDGQQIAFYEHDDGEQWLGVASADGTNARRLVMMRPVHDPVRPVWSPDGSEIYVERGPPPGSNGIGGDTDILAVDAVSGSVRVVVDSPHFDGGPQLSPDGSTLVFIHQQPEAGGGIGIQTVPVGGGAPLDLTGDPTANVSPSWLPDGRIAFIGSRQGARGSTELYVMQADGSGVVNLSNSPADDVAFPVGHEPVRASPDGEWIAFESNRSGSLELHIARTDGTEVRQISHGTNASASHPVWSPDSRYLAYPAVIDDRDGLWINRIEDGATALAGPAGLMHWEIAVGPTPRPSVTRSGVWLLEIESGAATLLTADREDPWVSSATFGTDGMPRVELWEDGAPLQIRHNLEGRVLKAAAPSLGCTTLDEEALVIVTPAPEARTFEGVTCGVRSPDGQLMTYRLDAGLVELRAGIEVPSWDQWLIDLGSGERTLLRAAMRHCGGCDTGYREAWSSSSRYVVLPELAGEVYLADAATGATRQISEVDNPTYRRFKPQWAPTRDRLVYPAGSGGTIYEDLEAGTRRELELAWPATFDQSGRFLYSPAWGLGGRPADPVETTIYDLQTGVAVTLAGDARAELILGATNAPIALVPDAGGTGALVAALEDGPDCRGTVIVRADGSEVTCVLNGRNATFSPDGASIVLTRRGTELTSANGSPWPPGRFDLLLVDPLSGTIRVIARDLYSSTPPGIVWNEAGTHLLIRWPNAQGV